MDAPTEYKQFSDEDNEPGPSTNQTRRGTRGMRSPSWPPTADRHPFQRVTDVER